MTHYFFRFTFILLVVSFTFNDSVADEKTYVIRIDNFFGGPIHKTNHEYELRGEIAYLGNSPLESIKIHYQIGDQVAGSELFENIGINPYVPFRYEVSEKWIPENEEVYEINIWFTELNGGDPDEGVSDTVSVFVEVYDQLAERQMALLESFSSINCGSCAIVTPSLLKIVDENPENYAMIYYHPRQYENSPLYHFNPKDQDIRRDYYDVFYTPFSAIGNLYKGVSEGVEEQLMQLESLKWSGFSLQGNWYIANDSLHINVEGEIFVNTNHKDYRLLIAGIEESVHFDEPPGTNHEKDFYHVMRFFAPDAQGIKLVDEDRNTSFAKTISKPWYEGLEADSLRMIAFIQEMSTSEISQVVKFNYQAPDDGDDVTFIAEISGNPNSLRVYPNPANQYLRLKSNINGIVPEKIMVFNLQGKHITTRYHTDYIDIGNISSGIYYLLIQSENSIYREKISIIR